MIIKIANTKTEINDAMVVRKHVFVEEQQVPLDIELDEYDETAIHFVGYLNDEPVCASRLRIINNCGKLERICVLKRYRGNGYGVQVIKAMEEKLLQKNVSISKLNAQVQAVDFYKKLGYDVISKPFTEANILHVTMEKQLKLITV